MSIDRTVRMGRIWDVILDVPEGRVASYGQIAAIAGFPRGARQVAYALRHAPRELQLPWYRIITASGRIAFAEGSAAFKEQRERLRVENVPVTRGRVDMRQYRWEPDLDELLWKPGAAWDQR